MRALTPILLATGLAVSLAACSPQAAPASADCAATPSGSASDAVKVTGEFNSMPKVTVSDPLTNKTTERTTVIQGDGAVVKSGDTVSVQITLYSGDTGEELTGTGYTEGSETSFTLDEKLLPGLVKTLECSTEGSRVVGVITPEDAFGDAGSAQLGLQPGQALVAVVDVLAIAEPPLPKADGEDQPAPEGFPAVELDETGRPTITIPDAPAPTELMIALLKKGDGAVVEPGSDVIVHYVGINWNTNKVFDESWARGEPATFNTTQVIAGFTKALEGQKVGSQVIVVIPPSEGYGDAGAGADIGPNDTIVFVIDILGIA